MSNHLSRDTEDAAKVLSALRDKYHPQETLPEKLSAAEDLRAKFVNVASGVRKWSVKPVGDDTWVTLQGAGTVQLHTALDTGQIQISADGTNWRPLPLEYDPVNHEWVGSALDMEVVLPPGERRPRKAALLALCEELARLLDSGLPGSVRPSVG